MFCIFLVLIWDPRHRGVPRPQADTAEEGLICEDVKYMTILQLCGWRGDKHASQLKRTY